MYIHKNKMSNNELYEWIIKKNMKECYQFLLSRIILIYKLKIKYSIKI